MLTSTWTLCWCARGDLRLWELGLTEVVLSQRETQIWQTALNPLCKRVRACLCSCFCVCVCVWVCVHPPLRSLYPPAAKYLRINPSVRKRSWQAFTTVWHTQRHAHTYRLLFPGRKGEQLEKNEIILQDDVVTLLLAARDCLLFFCACSRRLKHIFTRLCSYMCGVPLTASAQRDNCSFLGGSEMSLLFSSFSLVVCVHSWGGIMQLLE